MHVDWKPRGTFQTQPVNPAQAWSTILDWDPMFGVDVILACCNQALGILEMRADYEQEERDERQHARHRSSPRIAAGHLAGILKWAGGVAGALVVAFLTYRFGWS